MLKYLKNIAIFLCHLPFLAMLVSYFGDFNTRTLIICILWAISSMLIYRFCRCLSEKQAFVLQTVLWIAGIIRMSYFGWILAVEPAWDFGRIYHGALDITTNGALTYTMPYYLESYNNFFITLCLVPWFIIMSVVGVEPLYSGIILNILLIAFAQLFAVWTVNISSSKTDGLAVQIFCTLFLPFYTYAPIFYTDTFSMPFITFVLLVYAVVKNKKVTKKTALLLYVIAGIATFLGFKLKPTAALAFIAIVILSVLDEYKDSYKNIAAAVITICICSIGYSMFESNTDIINLSDIDDYRLPPEHYVMMGLKYNGGYNPEDHDFSLSFDNIRDRKDAEMQQIKDRLSEYGLSGYIRFLFGKIRYTWADGTFYAPHKLDIDPLRHSIAGEFFTESGKYYDIYETVMSGVQLSLIIFMLIGSYNKKDIYVICSMCVFAAFVFLLIWETRSRYIVNLIPIFIVLASDGIKRIEEKVYGKEKSKTGGPDYNRNLADRVNTGI